MNYPARRHAPKYQTATSVGDRSTQYLPAPDENAAHENAARSQRLSGRFQTRPYRKEGPPSADISQYIPDTARHEDGSHQPAYGSDLPTELYPLSDTSSELFQDVFGRYSAALSKLEQKAEKFSLSKDCVLSEAGELYQKAEEEAGSRCNKACHVLIFETSRDFDFAWFHGGPRTPNTRALYARLHGSSVDATDDTAQRGLSPTRPPNPFRPLAPRSSHHAPSHQAQGSGMEASGSRGYSIAAEALTHAGEGGKLLTTSLGEDAYNDGWTGGSELDRSRVRYIDGARY